MRQLLLAGLLAASALTGVASAQDENDVDEVLVPVGPFDYRVEMDAPLSACISERSETIDGSFVQVQVIVRFDEETRVPLMVYRTEALGPLEDAQVGECYPLSEDAQ